MGYGAGSIELDAARDIQTGVQNAAAYGAAAFTGDPSEFTSSGGDSTMG